MRGGAPAGNDERRRAAGGGRRARVEGRMRGSWLGRGHDQQALLYIGVSLRKGVAGARTRVPPGGHRGIEAVEKVATENENMFAKFLGQARRCGAAFTGDPSATHVSNVRPYTKKARSRPPCFFGPPSAAPRRRCRPRAEELAPSTATTDPSVAHRANVSDDSAPASWLGRQDGHARASSRGARRSTPGAQHHC